MGALGFSFAIRSSDPEVARSVERTFQDLPSVAGPPATTYSLVDRGPRTAGQHVLYAGPERLTLSHDLPRVLRRLLWHVNQQVVAQGTNTHVLLHAAVASRDGAGVVLAAPMESGKSTLVAGLVRAGLDYLSDEVAAIDPLTLDVDSYPKPITLDTGSWTVLPGLEPAEVPTVTQWQVPASTIRPGSVVGRTAVRLVVTPSYDAAGTTRLVPASRAAMLTRLLVSSFNRRDQPARRLEVLARVLRGARCYQLDVSDLDLAVELVADALEAIERKAS